MKTKDRILEQSRLLFNQQGINAVSLRDIAAAMPISYGNLTYHFSNKAALVTQLYIEMMEEHRVLGLQIRMDDNLLLDMLSGPLHTFQISLKYLFLFYDYAEIIRQFPTLYQLQKSIFEERKPFFYPIFARLQEQGFFRTDISVAQLDYIMELSSALRSFFFIRREQQEMAALDVEKLKKEYTDYINRLLYPYLTSAGQRLYDDWMGRL